MLSDPAGDSGSVYYRVVEQLVPWPEGVQYRVPVGDQVFPALDGQADGIAEDRRRERLRNVGHVVDRVMVAQPVEDRGGRDRELWPPRAYGRLRQQRGRWIPSSIAPFMTLVPGSMSIVERCPVTET
jgi:hypothetical protein